jgi:hypothetical protein
VQRFPLAFLIAVTALEWGPAARAGSPPVGRVETDAARELFRQGRELYKKNQIAEAHGKFLAAFGIKKHWQIALNLGATEMLLERFRDAAEHLTWAESESRASPEDDDIRWLRSRLPDVLQRVATLMVTADAGVEVRIDDEQAPVALLGDAVFLDPGHHEVSVSSLGRSPTRIPLDLVAGELRRVDVTLPPEASTRGQPDIDPERFAGASYPNATGASTRTVVLFTGGALAVVGVGLGFYFFAKSSAADSDALRLRSSVTQQFGDPNAPGGPTGPGCTVSNDLCQALSRAVYDRAAAAERARFAFVAAGVLATTTAAAWLLWPRIEAHETKGRLNFGANGRSVWVEGSF